jgi:hypothetical protein
MVLTVLVPVTTTASSSLSLIAFSLILVSSCIFGLFNWKLAIVPTLVAWIPFYFEYLTPQRLYYWAAYLFPSFNHGQFFEVPYTPVYLRPDILAIGFFFLGSVVYFASIVYSRRSGSILIPLAKFLIVPSVMLFLFEIVIGSISIAHMFTPVILGFQVNFVPDFVWQITNLQLLGFSTLVIICSALILYLGRNSYKMVPVPGQKVS